MIKYIVILLILFAPLRLFAQSEAAYRQHVETLCNPAFEGRKAGTAGCDKAAEYLKSTLEKFGYRVEEQVFQVNRHPTKNLVTTVGSGNEYIVVGAHYDAQGKGMPGADDNASGSAMVLELARSFRKMPAWRPVVFILFSGEEDGMLGSKYYCDHPLLPKSAPSIKKHVFMVNLDMVGHLGTPRVDGHIIDLPEVLLPLFQQYPFARDITLKGNTDDSDNWPFYRKNVQVVFIHTGLSSGYHTPRDTAASLNYSGMVKVHRYVEDLIRSVSALPLPDNTISEPLGVLEYKP
jgi:Zn-dependent M28 family amino/carboxypeptidase